MKNFKEGDVVVAPSKRHIDDSQNQSKEGTIAFVLLDNEYLVLDSSDILHKVKGHEIYLSQGNE